MKKNKVFITCFMILLSLVCIAFTAYTVWVSYNWYYTSFDAQPQGWVLIVSVVLLILCIIREVLVTWQRLIKVKETTK